MNKQELLSGLAKLAIEHGPEIAGAIRDLVKKAGTPVDTARYDRALEILSRDPESYFGERRQQ